MTASAILLVGCVIGFVLGRWSSIILGLVAGVVALGASLVSTGQPGDTPAVFVAVIAGAALALGVAARHRMESRAG
jgi:hypothetical protein